MDRFQGKKNKTKKHLHQRPSECLFSRHLHGCLLLHRVTLSSQLRATNFIFPAEPVHLLPPLPVLQRYTCTTDRNVFAMQYSGMNSSSLLGRRLQSIYCINLAGQQRYSVWLARLLVIITATQTEGVWSTVL